MSYRLALDGNVMGILPMSAIGLACRIGSDVLGQVGNLRFAVIRPQSGAGPNMISHFSSDPRRNKGI